MTWTDSDPTIPPIVHEPPLCPVCREATDPQPGLLHCRPCGLMWDRHNQGRYDDQARCGDTQPVELYPTLPPDDQDLRHPTCRRATKHPGPHAGPDDTDTPPVDEWLLWTTNGRRAG